MDNEFLQAANVTLAVDSSHSTMSTFIFHIVQAKIGIGKLHRDDSLRSVFLIHEAEFLVGAASYSEERLMSAYNSIKHALGPANTTENQGVF